MLKQLLPFMVPVFGPIALVSGMVGTAAGSVAAATVGAALIGNELDNKSLGMLGANLLNALNILKSKDYFTTEEAMVLLQFSKPTILRKFDDWKKNPNDADGLQYEGPGGRGGYRVSRNTIENYAKNHGIILSWDKLALVYLDKQSQETEKNTGISQKDQILQSIELDNLFLEEAKNELQRLESIAKEEKNPQKLNEISQSILVVKMRVKSIEYDKKALELSLEKKAKPKKKK